MTIPIDESLAGTYTVKLLANTNYNVKTYISVNLMLIEPCSLEIIDLIDGTNIKRSFTM